MFEILEMMQDETPSALGNTLARMPAEMRPEFVRIGSLDKALADPSVRGPGLYFLEFKQVRTNTPRGYNGMSMDLHKRLGKHAWYANIMGVPHSSITVYIASGKHRDQHWHGAVLKAKLRARETTINQLMKKHFPGRLSNQKRELETAVMGEEEEVQDSGCACRWCRS